MGGRGRGQSIAANPVLIGAATTLVVIVAVFLSYNANNGLPFVPTYELKAEVPSAAQLVRGNEVRIGGARIGVVNEIKPKNHKNGLVTALLSLKLDKSVEPLPKDSTILVRPKSALGLKYVEITQGNPTGRGFEAGATIPLKQATPKPVEIDEVFNTFDKPTRDASQRNLLEFGNAFAGRGRSINDALVALPGLLRNLEPVMQNLSDPNTHLNQFFKELGDAASIVAPAAETQAELFRNLDTTFTALSTVARPFIQDTITNANPSLDESIRDFPFQRVFLRNSEGFFRELRPGVRALRDNAPILSDALAFGIPTLKRSILLSQRTTPLFHDLERFSKDAQVSLGIRRLTDTVRSLNPTLKQLTPIQTTCNYATLWFRNVASLLSEGDANGTWQRFIIITTPQGPNNEGGPSSGPASGPTKDNHVHTNPYPNVGAPGQTNECEAANETYTAGQTALGNQPGNQGLKHDRTTIKK
jgi:virulence factor Mce-like protein